MDPPPALPVQQNSAVTHLMPIERVPEELNAAASERASSAACSFTHIEGVLERLTIAKSSRRETPRISVISDIEGIPERQWIFSMRMTDDTGVHQERDRSLSKGDEGQDSTKEVSRGTVQEPLHQPIVCEMEPHDDERTQQSEMPVLEDLSVDDVEMETVTVPSIPPMGAVSSPSHHHATVNPSEISSSPSVLDRQTLPREESFAPMESDGFISPAAPTEPSIMEGHVEEEKRSSLLGNGMQSCLEHCDCVMLPGSDMGMQWVNGCRRSQRNRCKPLRWWDGERKVYGRKHHTMVTVTGYVTKSPKPEWPRPSPRTTTRTKRSR